MGDQDMLAHQTHTLLFPFHLTGFSDEGCDGLGIVLGAYEEHLVVQADDRIAVGDRHLTVMQEAGDDEITSQKLAYLPERAAVERLVGGLKGHLMGSHVGVGSMLGIHLSLLLAHVHMAKVAQRNGSTDDTHHTQRIGTGISVGNGRSLVGTEYLVACLTGSTQTRGIGHGSTEHTDHHREVDRVLAMAHAAAIPEDQEEQRHATEHIEQDDARGQKVEANAALAETLEEARSHLQAYTIDKKDESEVLDEVHEHRRTGIRHLARHSAQLVVDVSGKDSSEEHEGDSQGDAAYLDLAKSYADRDDQRVEQHHMCHTARTGE